jgi:HEXXH motif-containing protein
LRQRLAADIPLEPAPAPPRISNYDTTCYTSDQLGQLSRWWDTEPANRMALTAASAEQCAQSRQAIERAMHYLRMAAPALHAEVEIIVRDIVLAKPDGSNLIDYGGASSFGLWGAITINVETHRDWTQFYRQIVHETGHNLLFAIARDEPLVKADPSLRRPSPLRDDPRPLDGIFHAAYVSAREAVALEALIQWHEDGGRLPPEDVSAILDALEQSVLAFRDCVETLRGDGEGPTELGSAVLTDCEAFMNENFALEPC